MTFSFISSRRFRRWAIGLGVVAALAGTGAALGYDRYFSGGEYQPVSWEFGSDIPQSLQASLDADVAANPWVHAASLYVHAPAAGLDHAFAAGFSDPGSGIPMTSDHAGRIASITKTYVAATAITLAEQGVLSLDDSLSDTVSPHSRGLLAADGYDIDAIQLEHLLNHRSGIADYAQLGAYTRQIVTADLLGQRRVWTRDGQLVFALDRTDPHWAPGGGFAYSDTGYILLGEAIERATDQPLHEVVRTSLGFERLGLTATWWEKLEPAPTDVPRAQQFSGKANVNGIDGSIDLFGGGGLMATTRDTGRAMRAIVRGDVFADPASVDVMQRLTEGNYANGIVRYVFASGHTCWGHSGYWGLVAFHCPAEDVTIAMSYSQANVQGLRARSEAILAEIGEATR